MTTMFDQMKLYKSWAVVLTVIFILLSAVTVFGVTDSTRVNTVPELPPVVRAEVYRTFDGLSNINNQNLIVDPIIPPNIQLPDSVEQLRAYAETLLQQVTDGQRYVETLNSLTELDLPVGVVKSGGSLDYAILINSMTFTTRGAIMDVFVSLKLPQTGSPIAFHGKIPLSKDGGIAGTARVDLVGDHFIQLTEKSQLGIFAKDTYVEFDCSGFVGLSLNAQVEFSRDLIVPEQSNGSVLANEDRVKVDIKTYAHSLNDLLVGVTIPPFQVAGMKGFGFTVTQATMDWSDTRNPQTMSFPAGYTSPFVQSGQPLLWQGFFLQDLELRLPQAFEKKKSDSTATTTASAQRIKIDVHNMILDDQGFTGSISMSPILDVGDMSGWSYSIDKLALDLVTNQVKGFEIDGKLTIPVIKASDGKNTQFGYIAQRSADGNYMLSVSIQNEVKLPLFVADLHLVKGSSVVVTERNDKFYPKAILNGSLDISIAEKGPKASFAGIKFEGLTISTEAPYFDLKSVGFGEDGKTQSVSKYPLTIKNIDIKKDADRLGLGFDVTVNIGGGEGEEGFGGTAGLVVWAKHKSLVDWQFDKVDLTGIGIKISKPGVVELDGMINFFSEDPVYGDGFKGSLKGKIQIISLDIEALFGKTPTYRYWFADAMVELKSGVPLLPGISAYGFGGGFYSKMKQTTQSSGSKIGMTASGVTYIPDENTLGIKAMVKFGATASQEPYNGMVMLEVEMNSHGGLNSVTFTGNVNVMANPLTALVKDMVPDAVAGKATDKLASMVGSSQISANVKIFFDNVNHVFHANMEMYINVLGGVIKGVGQNNRAGWSVMHFEPGDWYFLVGTPSDPVGLEILWLVKTKSYFMLGKHLPGSPPPPRQVSEILGIDASDLDYMRDLNALESGLGFAFGMSITMDTGDMTFLMFYARLAAGIGTDIMIKQYGNQYHCEGSSDPIGINGWYANGQAYAYVMGKIGIKVNLRFYHGNFDIISLGVAAILQTKAPNPFWMKGIVGGYYRILGGLVKGHCKFEVVIGKDCKIVGPSNPLADVKMIAGITPPSDSKDVDVFNSPQVAFNIPVGEIFDITDVEGKRHIFRASLDQFDVLDGINKISGDLQWNDDHDVVVFNSHDVLPGQRPLTAKASLTFEESANGIWTKVKFDGVVVLETAQTSFTTGEAPDYIPASNVQLSYPLPDQLNFYAKEYGKGMIQLKRGQAYLFTLNNQWLQKLRMTDIASQNYVEGGFTYDDGAKRISFDIPNGLELSRIYNCELLNIPNQTTKVDENVTKVQTTLTTGDTLTTKSLQGQIDRREIKSIYLNPFRTSKYSTFVDKMKNIKIGDAYNIQVGQAVTILESYLQGDEAFVADETVGSDVLGPLVTMEATLSDNSWYDNVVFPLVYKDYPYHGMTLSVRPNPDRFGIPPSRDLYIKNEVLSGQPDVTQTPLSFQKEMLVYNVGESVNTDFFDLRNQVANYYIKNPGDGDTRLQQFILSPIPVLKYGQYNLVIRYQAPGAVSPSTTFNVSLFNTVRD